MVVPKVVMTAAYSDNWRVVKKEHMMAKMMVSYWVDSSANLKVEK